MNNKSYRLERSQVIPKPLAEVFSFFTNTENLELITPEFLRFRILTPTPIRLELGALIDYRLRLFRIPFRWRTCIETLEPERRFIDIQLSGPYRRWHHVHEFSEVPEGTLVRDVVDYALPLGPLGTMAHALFVRRMLEEIFDYRRDRVARFFQ